MFDNSQLKTKRATKHITDLHRKIVTFTSRKPYRRISEKDLDSGRYVLKVHKTQGLPSDIPAIIGDAVHNLRSALDLMTCDLVKAGGTITNLRSVHFPFGKDLQDFEERLGDRKIDKAAPEVITLMRALKPYPSGNAQLCGLHELDIRDKHTTIIAALGVAQFTWTEYSTDVKTKETIKKTFTSSPVVHGEAVKEFPNVRIDEQNPYFQPDVLVVFEKGQPFEGEAVIQTLTQLSTMVQDILKTFEPYG